MIVEREGEEGTKNQKNSVLFYYLPSCLMYLNGNRLRVEETNYL